MTHVTSASVTEYYDTEYYDRVEAVLLDSPGRLVTDARLRRLVYGWGRPLRLGGLRSMVSRLSDDLAAEGRGTLTRVPDVGWVYDPATPSTAVPRVRRPALLGGRAVRAPSGGVESASRTRQGLRRPAHTDLH
jgi:hypothetical protein